MNIYVISLTN